MESYVDAVQHPKNLPALFRYTIPKEEAPVALRDLALMGIDNMSMFGGLEGCAKASTSKLLLQTPEENFKSRSCSDGRSKAN